MSLVMMIIGAAMIITAAVLGFNRFGYEDRQTEKSQKAAEILYGLMDDTKPGMMIKGEAEKPMVVMDLEGMDIVGYLFYPKDGEAQAVQASYSHVPLVPGVWKGTPQTGDFYIALADLPNLEIGDEVQFIDVMGYAYLYRVDAVSSDIDLVDSCDAVLFSSRSGKISQIILAFEDGGLQ